MTASQIRPSSQVRKDFLDFFKSKQHTIVPSFEPHAGFAEPAVHERRHEPVRARSSSARPNVPTRPVARRTRRSASAPAASTTTSTTSASTPITTRFSRCSATGASAIISRRRRSTGRGNSSSRSGNFRRNAFTPPCSALITVSPAGKEMGDRTRTGPGPYDDLSGFIAANPMPRPLKSPTRRPRCIGRRNSPPPAAIPRSTSSRQQEGQFLDDGRHRPVRSVHRIAR